MSTGPIPKRSDQRRRTNEPAAGAPRKAPGAGGGQLKVKRGWNPAAKKLFNSVAESGITQFYEPSDWAGLWLICDFVDQVWSSGEKPSAADMAVILKAWSQLGVAEGDRRRMGIELQQPEPDGELGDVTWFEEAKQRLAGAG